MQQNLNSLSGKAIIIYDRLLKRFGLPEWRDPMPAIDELVSTILSQNTNDKNRDVAFNALITHVPNLGRSSRCRFGCSD